MLIEVKIKTEHYFRNKNGQLHGEYKMWRSNGQLYEHSFWQNGNDITDEIKDLVSDINNITDEEKLLIMLKWGILLC